MVSVEFEGAEPGSTELGARNRKGRTGRAEPEGQNRKGRTGRAEPGRAGTGSAGTGSIEPEGRADRNE
ncbi:hypothetical protein B6K86_03495 [Lachnospiraceae bacterium]|nr:hypothetical protein B6K86_03495 [Lachnospiraceae bacterium]